MDGKAFEEYTEHYVHYVAFNTAPIDLKMTEIEQESEADSSIRSIRTIFHQGVWNEEASPFKLFETELCFSGEV